MSLRCQSLGVAAVAVIAVGLADACGDAGTAPAAAAFGPESLQVRLVSAPDTLNRDGYLVVAAVAYNRTHAGIVVPFPCAAGGFLARVMSGQTAVAELQPAACSGAGPSSAVTIAPGDSVLGTLAGAAPQSAGAYTLQLRYGSSGGQSRVVERPLVVRSALSCAPSDGRVEFGVQVDVADATTGGPTRTAASAVATSGSQSEPLGPTPGVPGVAVPLAFVGLIERPGTYAVTVTAPGYRPRTADNVVVRVGENCHVQTVRLKALLQPAS